MPRRQYPSLKEVAERAGVSFQTASKVLNGGNVRVSQQTMQRILDAADALGYSPNVLARGLVTQSTCTLGLVLGDLTDGAMARFAVGVEQAARRRGLAILVGNLSGVGSESVDGAAVIRMLMERRVDGVIAAAPQLEDDLQFADALRGGHPAVSLEHVPQGGVPLVGSDHREVGRMATEHLIERGHQVIGTITGPYHRRVVRSRLRGYEDALRAAELEPSEDLVVEADWTARGAARSTELLLDRSPEVTGIFVHSDTMAIGVLSGLASSGRSVPDDVALVSCDDMPFAEYLCPPLTSIRLPFVETGELAVELLMKQVAGEKVPSGAQLVPVELVVRDSSTGPVRSNRRQIDPYVAADHATEHTTNRKENRDDQNLD